MANQHKLSGHMHRSSVAALVVLVLALGWYFEVLAQSPAPAVPAPVAQLHQLYLPLVNKQEAAQATPTATALPTATGNPTATVTPTPTPTAPPAAEQVALFLESNWRTSSASIQKDGQGGLHAAYYYYEGQHGGAPNYATYAYCAAACDSLANWAKVNLAEDRDVVEVQLAITNAGQPRVLLRVDSTVYPGGKDYLYAACEQSCTTSAGWQTGYVLSSHGTLNGFDDDSPQRSFVLDPQGRPRFLYQDANFIFAEPDRYGHYYVSCEANCTGGTPEQPTWQQTRITKKLNHDYEVMEFAALTFTKAGQPRIFGYLNPIRLTSDAPPAGLYYFGCDTACDNAENWQRVYLLDRGGGADASWDLTLDSQDRPRVALYRGDETFEAETLLYLWCNEQCLDQATKDDHWQFNKPGVAVTDGRHPDLALNAQGQPRIAYVDDTVGGLGYAWCTANCESDNASWYHQAVEGEVELQSDWPVPLPVSCVSGLWHGLTPVLSLDGGDNATVAYDTTYHAQCLYDDPSDGEPPFTARHEIVRAVRAITFGLE